MPRTRAQGEADDPKGVNLPSNPKRKAGSQSGGGKGKQRARTEGDEAGAESSVAHPVVERESSVRAITLFRGESEEEIEEMPEAQDLAQYGEGEGDGGDVGASRGGSAAELMRREIPGGRGGEERGESQREVLSGSHVESSLLPEQERTATTQVPPPATQSPSIPQHDVAPASNVHRSQAIAPSNQPQGKPKLELLRLDGDRV